MSLLVISIWKNKSSLLLCLMLSIASPINRGVLGGLASIVVSGIATLSKYNSEENYLAVFPDEPRPGAQAAFLFITLAISGVSGLGTGYIAKALCGKLQPRVYNDDRFFEKAFR